MYFFSFVCVYTYLWYVVPVHLCTRTHRVVQRYYYQLVLLLVCRINVQHCTNQAHCFCNVQTMKWRQHAMDD
jgi:hypothetical protein